ncbi:MAG: c-type cytochrome [Verrucomicrobiales bacterium]|nr:c-type cytochrome [Verrucomicrobiales bacterium]
MKRLLRSSLALTTRLSAIAALAQSEPATTARSPAEELASFRLADPQLTVELVVSEPDVVSPVCVAWDADGRLFVVEMSDYPNASNKGRVKLLEDADGDGHYERVTLFAEGLPFPTSVLPWKGGAIVASAPDIWFVKDNNGDGRADERRVLFTGFGEGNQQLRVNGLRWGIDNWVYGANGRSDGEIRQPDDLTRKTISIRRRDFRFKPETLEFEAIAGPSQFGCAADDWGNRFLSWNTIPIRHVVIEERYLDRNPYLSSPQSLQDCLPADDTKEVFPLTPAPLVFNEESSSHFNALAGLTIYRGDALGRDPAGRKYRGNAFMGESLRNLVHRRILEPNGSTFTAKRGEQGKEFLASTDPWFHPVNFATGPDGALYVVDFYRRFVEHPNYVHDSSVTNKIPWRMGAEHGRIWRVSSKEAGAARLRPRRNLSQATPDELARLLTSDNGWRRDTAQRLLVERQDKQAGAALQKLLLDQPAHPASAHALWTLDALSALDTDTLAAALKIRSNPGLVANALRLAEPRLATEATFPQAVLALAGTHEHGVRLQLELTVGEIRRSDWRGRKYEALTASPPADEWHQRATLSSMSDWPWLGLERFLSDRSQKTKAATADPAFLERLASLVGANHNEADLEDCASHLADSALPAETRIAILAGLADGMTRTRRSFQEWLARVGGQSPGRRDALAALIRRAVERTKDFNLGSPARTAAIRLLSHVEASVSREAISELLRSKASSEVLFSAVRAVVQLNDPALSKAVFANWQSLGPSTRRQLLAESPRSTAMAMKLRDAVADGLISTVEIPAGTRAELQRMGDSEIRRAFVELLKSAAPSDRRETIRRFEPALGMDGEPKRGAEIFGRTCLICHVIKGRGAQVGPDLSGVGTRPKETLLVDILDPGRALSPDWLSYTVEPAEGEALSGLIVTETETHITMRRAQQPDESIPRARIKTIRADGKSLMPEGLEAGLSTRDIADLLEFLRRPDPALLPKE